MAVPYVDLVFQMIQLRVDSGTANRGSVDVDRYDAARVAGGEHRADSTARTHVEHVSVAVHERWRDLRGEELTGARHLRIEHAWRDDEGRAKHSLNEIIVVPILPGELVGNGHCLADEPADQWQARRLIQSRQGWRIGLVRSLKHFPVAPTESSRLECRARATVSTHIFRIRDELQCECSGAMQPSRHCSGRFRDHPARWPRLDRE